ncbi:MAG TPA: O-methyltransferase [Anaerolineales bacterium]
MTVYNDPISEYIVGLFALEDEALQNARQDSIREGLPMISVKPEEGRFLQFLVRSGNVRRAVEVGTLGGYSGIWIARGLAPGGRLVTLEIDQHHAEVARRHFRAAGVEDRVEVREGDAHHSLQDLASEGPFDFIFIDADKTGNDAYFDWALENIRPGGMIAAHNAFRKGSVAGQGEPDEYTQVMQAFNRRVAATPQLVSTIYPAGDGMILAVKPL